MSAPAQSHPLTLAPNREAVLLRCAAAGEGWAVDALITAYRPAVLGFIERRIRPRQDAEDVTQAAFIEALPALRGLEPGQLWLPMVLAIARCRMTDLARRRGRQERLLQAAESLPSPEVLSPAELVTAAADCAELRQAMADSLTPDEIDVLFLRADGLSADETATSLGSSRRRVWRLITRARSKLAAAFER